MNSTTDPRIIGRRLFTDGIERDVYEDAEGRQHVIGHAGECVYGTWLAPPDAPLIVSAKAPIRCVPR